MKKIAGSRDGFVVKIELKGPGWLLVPQKVLSRS